MRHSNYGRKLGRNRDQRNALYKSLLSALILSGKIQTTLAKAKSIKGLVDRLINQAKSASTRRLVSQFLVQRRIQDKLFDEIVPRVQSRGSGYTSIVKLGFRKGDAASMVQMRLLLDNKKVSQVQLAGILEEGQQKGVESKGQVRTRRSRIVREISDQGGKNT